MKLLPRLIPAALLLLFSLDAAGIEAQETDRLYRTGRQAYQEKLYSLAYTSLTDFLDQTSWEDPRADDAAYLAGISALRDGQYGAAEELFASFGQRHPGSPYQSKTSYWLGTARYAQEEYGPARRAFEAQLEAKGEAAFYLRSLRYAGVCARLSGDADGAETLSRRLLDESREQGESSYQAAALSALGELYLAQGRYREARQELGTLIMDFPDHDASRRGLYLLGEAYYQEGKPEEAEKRFRRYLDLYAGAEKTAQAAFRVVELARERDDAAGAEEHLAFLKRYAPESGEFVEARELVAGLTLEMGRLNEAEGLYRDLLDEPGTSRASLLYHLGLTREAAGDEGEARDYYARAVEALSDEFDAQTSAASDTASSTGSDRFPLTTEDLQNLERRIRKHQVMVGLAEAYPSLAEKYPRSEERYEAAETLFDSYCGRQDWASLEDLTDGVLYSEPGEKRAAAWAFRRGDVRLERQLLGPALQDFRRAAGTIPEAQYRIGYIYTLQKEYGRADDEFAQLQKRLKKAPAAEDLETEEFDESAVAADTADSGDERSDEAAFWTGDDSGVPAGREELLSRTRLARGLCSYNLGNYEEARQRLNHLALGLDAGGGGQSLDPWRGQALFYRGKAEQKTGRLLASTESFQDAVGELRDPAFRGEAQYQLGWSFLQLQQYERARDVLQKLLQPVADGQSADSEADRRSDQARLLIGRSFQQEGRWDAAMDSFRPITARSGGKGLKEARFRMIETLVRAGRDGDLSEYEGSEWEDARCRAWEQTAADALDLGRMSRAEELYERRLEESLPVEPELYIKKSYAEMDQKKWQEAAASILTAAREAPDSPVMTAAGAQLGDVISRAWEPGGGDPPSGGAERALVWLQDFRDKGVPPEAWGPVALAYAGLLFDAEPDKAEVWVQRVLEASPEEGVLNKRALLISARLAFSQGRFSRAEEILDPLRQTEEAFVSARARLLFGRLLQERGDVSEAAGEWMKIYLETPGQRDAAAEGLSRAVEAYSSISRPDRAARAREALSDLNVPKNSADQ